jgi:hypothetical protein
MPDVARNGTDELHPISAIHPADNDLAIRSLKWHGVHLFFFGVERPNRGGPHRRDRPSPLHGQSL